MTVDRLTKNPGATTYIPGTPGVAASPGQPYRAAYTSYETRTVCGFVQSSVTYKWMLVTKPDGTQSYEYVPTGGSGAMSYQCRQQTVPVYHPEQPYIAPTPGVPSTPAQMAQDLNLGWNGGARSINYMSGSGQAVFTIPPGVKGVAVGLIDRPTGPVDYTNLHERMHFAVVVVDPTLPEFAGMPAMRVWDRAAGTYTPIPDSYRLDQIIMDRWTRPQRDGSMLQVWAGGNFKIFTSINEIAAKDLCLAACLYAAEDSVEGAMIGSMAAGIDIPYPADAVGANVVLLPLTLASGDDVAGANLAMLPMTVESYQASGASLALLPMTILAGDDRAGASLVLQPMTMNAGADGRSYVVNGAALMLPVMILGVGMADAPEGVSLALRPMAMLAGDDIAGASVALPLMTLDASAFEGNTMATMGSSAGAATPSTTGLVSLAGMTVHLAAASDFSLGAVMHADITVSLKAWAGVPVLSEAGEVWVVNEEGASSMYEGFSFNSFATHQGRHLAVRADGLYLLGGDLDGDQPIRASVNLGTQDFGTSLGKTVDNCYVGVASDGHLYLRITANDKQYLYKTQRSADFLKTQRIVPGRGLRATHLTFELLNENGADFQLASVEFVAAALSRRT